jgi:hypothetical protein
LISKKFRDKNNKQIIITILFFNGIKKFNMINKLPNRNNPKIGKKIFVFVPNISFLGPKFTFSRIMINDLPKKYKKRIMNRKIIR